MGIVKTREIPGKAGEAGEMSKIPGKAGIRIGGKFLGKLEKLGKLGMTRAHDHPRQIKAAVCKIQNADIFVIIIQQRISVYNYLL